MKQIKSVVRKEDQDALNVNTKNSERKSYRGREKLEEESNLLASDDRAPAESAAVRDTDGLLYPKTDPASATDPDRVTTNCGHDPKDPNGEHAITTRDTEELFAYHEHNHRQEP